MAFLRHLAAWALGRRRLLRIVGSSMAPGLRSGDLAWWEPFRAPSLAPPVGSVVLARHPYRRDLRMVKRVARVDADGGIYLLGDSPDESTDSRHFGALPPGHLLGRVHRV